MKQIRVAGMALVAVFAIGMLGAGVASAAEFKAAIYPVTVKGKATNPQGFEVAGAVTVCKNATFNTNEEGAANPTSQSETLEVHPTYTGCEVAIAGTFKAKVVSTGCNYLFHAATPKTKNGTTDVVCKPGKEINVNVEGLPGCTISVGPQTGLKTVEYVNEAGKVKVNAEVSGIKYKATSACGLVIGEGETGLYREGETSPTPKLAPAGHPAVALSEGFGPLGEADATEVTSTAPVHWFSGGLGPVARIASAEKVPVDAWGTLSLTNQTSGGKVECHNVIGGNIENPAPGGAEGPRGVGLTESFNPYGCESASCTPAATGGLAATYISVEAETIPFPFPENGDETNLKWPSHLLAEGAVIRAETEHIRIHVICHVQTGTNGKGEPEFGTLVEETQEGSNKPSTLTHCCKATAPPEEEFDAGAGLLHRAPPKESEKGKTEGNVKVLGYNEEEILNAKAG